MNGDERHRVSIDTERSVGVSKQSRVYPLLGSWSYCKPVQLPPARSGHSLVALTSKILLLFGGGPDENVSNEVYRIELSGKPGDKSVVCTYLHPNPKSQCPFERDRHSAWLWNGYMYIFGGEDVHGFMYSDIWKFDHKQLTWDEKAKCGETPSPRRGQTCTLVGSVVWIFGGLTFERDSVADVYTLDMERFEFKHKKHKAMPPCGRRGHSATAIDGYLYIFGGCDKTEVLLGDLWRLNLKTCVWEEVQPHFPGLGPPPSVGHAAAVFKNMLLTFGGNISSLKRESCSEVWLWDIQKGQWMQLKMKVEPQARRYVPPFFFFFFFAPTKSEKKLFRLRAVIYYCHVIYFPVRQ